MPPTSSVFLLVARAKQQHGRSARSFVGSDVPQDLRQYRLPKLMRRHEKIRLALESRIPGMTPNRPDGISRFDIRKRGDSWGVDRQA